MTNIVVLLVIALIVGAAILYIRREKKRGVKCVGCPYSGTCSSGKCQSGDSCGGGSAKE